MPPWSERPARSAWLPRRGEWLLPGASGLLLAASYPPLHLLFPPVVGLVPFAIWVARLPEGPGGAGSAARGGFVLGVVMHGLLLHWIVPALAWVTGWAVPVFLAVLAILAGLTALFGASLHRAIHRLSMPMWLALPVTWTGVEWLQAHLPGALAFPWLGLGTSLTSLPETVGVAEWVGARGVTFWLALANGLAATALLSAGGAQRRRTTAVVALVALVGVLAVPTGWGVHRARTLETRPAARIALISTSVSAEMRSDLVRWHEEATVVLERLLGEVPVDAVDLIVLPEGMLVGEPSIGNPPGEAAGSRSGDPAGAASLADRLRAQSERIGAPILVGAYLPEGRDGGRNSAVLIGASGPASYRYDKQRLVPLVETSPWAWSALGTGLGSARFQPGIGRATLSIAGVALGPLICFEAIFASEARAARAAGADVLVNLTNDGWFGIAGATSRVALHQHAAHIIMRAIETRAGAARVANVGFTFVVDPMGRTHAAGDPGAAGVHVATVRTTDMPTFHTRYGDLLGPASGLAVLVLMLGAIFRTSPSLDPRRTPM